MSRLVSGLDASELRSVLSREGFDEGSLLKWGRKRGHLTQVIWLDVEQRTRSAKGTINVLAGYVDPEVTELFFDPEMVPYRDFDYGTNMLRLKRAMGVPATDYQFASKAELSLQLAEIAGDVPRFVLPFFERFGDRREVWLEIVKCRTDANSCIFSNAHLPEYWLFDGMYGDCERATAQIETAIRSAQKWSWLIRLISVKRASSEGPTLRKLRRVRQYLRGQAAARPEPTGARPGQPPTGAE